MSNLNAFNIVVKPNGSICNMDCKYCFYLEKSKLYPGQQNFRMPDDILEKFIKEYIESQDLPTIHLTWQGGEPTLLGIDYFKRIVELQNKYADGKNIVNAVQTNAVLLDDKWCEFFNENNFLLGVSIDGPEQLHNKYRYYKNESPSFDDVMRGISFLKKHKVEFNTLTCVQKDNSYHPLEVYNFLKESGSQFMQFIPIVERASILDSQTDLNLVTPESNLDAEVTDWSVEPIQYGKFLVAIFDQWVRNDVGNYFVQQFEVALESWMGMRQSLCVFSKTCGFAMALEHNGDLYSCDHFVYSEYKLGNIFQNSLRELVDLPQQYIFGIDKQESLPLYCRECEFKFACNGECPKHRFIKAPNGEEGLNYLCKGYKYFFKYVDPYMRFMANEIKNNRPVDSVSFFAEEKEKGFPNFGIDRNDPCFCGSGKKFKKCCGKINQQIQ